MKAVTPSICAVLSVSRKASMGVPSRPFSIVWRMKASGVSASMVALPSAVPVPPSPCAPWQLAQLSA